LSKPWPLPPPQTIESPPSMSTNVTYLFDPLCGWCYGASPAIQQLAQDASVSLALAPTGMFSGGGRTLDAAFADYAWSNDVRIAKLTGQRFTEAYRANVLGKLGSAFDSTITTLALCAVVLTEPARELEVLKVLQEARYVEGLDTADVDVVAQLLRTVGLAAAAERLLNPDAALHEAHATRVQAAQRLMRQHRAQGVPALVVHSAAGDRLVQGQALYGSVENLRASVAQT
jgi:putative protein-disulfide isomerase